VSDLVRYRLIKPQIETREVGTEDKLVDPVRVRLFNPEIAMTQMNQVGYLVAQCGRGQKASSGV
jgi:hypothetical protein